MGIKMTYTESQSRLMRKDFKNVTHPVSSFSLYLQELVSLFFPWKVHFQPNFLQSTNQIIISFQINLIC